MNQSLKIVLLGFGNIGEWILEKILSRSHDENDFIESICCIDCNEARLEAKVSDQLQGLLNHYLLFDDDKTLSLLERITFSTSYEALAEADFLITSFSYPMDKSIKDRRDLLLKNAKILKDLARVLPAHLPDTLKVINISNPLDVITWKMSEYLNIPEEHIMGVSGMVDASRLMQALNHHFGISYAELKSYPSIVVGEHGNHMVPQIHPKHLKNKSYASVAKVIYETTYKGTEMLNNNNRIPPHIVVAEAVVNTIFCWSGRRNAKTCASIWNQADNIFVGTPIEFKEGSFQAIEHPEYLSIRASEYYQTSINAIKRDYQLAGM